MPLENNYKPSRNIGFNPYMGTRIENKQTNDSFFRKHLISLLIIILVVLIIVSAVTYFADSHQKSVLVVKNVDRTNTPPPLPPMPKIPTAPTTSNQNPS